MARLRPIVLFTFCLAAMPAAADVETWHPKPIFTQALCAKELGQGRSELAKRLKDAGLTVPTSENEKSEAADKYIAFLIQTDSATRRRAQAQAGHAGKWKGPTRFEVLKWRHKEYRIASCQQAKVRIPFQRALRIVGVSQPPSPTDEATRDQINGYIRIKKTRVACRRIRPWPKARACLSQYSKFQWVDKYPMTDSDHSPLRRK